MKLKLLGYKTDVLSLMWSFYFIMIMSLSAIIPHIQMVSIVLLVSVTAISVLRNGGTIKKTRVLPFVLWYVVFIGYVLLSRKWAIRFWVSDIPGTCTRIIICILCMMVYIDSYEKAEQMAKKFVLAAVVMNVIFMLSSNPSTWGSDHVIFGITGMHRNNLGCISSFSTILSIWIMNKNNDKRYRLVIPILVMGVIFSGSRTNMVVLILAMIMFTLFQGNVKKRTRWILIGLVAMIVLVIVYQSLDMSSSFAQKYLYRIFAIFDETYQDSSMNYRAMLKTTAVQLIMRSPIIGNGLEATAAYNASMGLAGISAHSNYYELWACYGLVGLGIYYCMYVYLIRKGLKQYKYNQGRKLSLIVFLVLTITEYQTFHEFDYFAVFLYMIVFALAEYSPNASD